MRQGQAEQGQGLGGIRGSTLSHDKERSYSVLVERLSWESVEYDAGEISRMPDRDNPLRSVNRPCFLLETFLNSHSGFDRHDLPGWLELFHAMMDGPADKIEKAAMVLGCALRVPKTLSDREFFGIKPSSKG
ncbi:hypothetical protein [Atopobium sp. oral taxon 416]|uniref:hypothetical protein n=1 Tax=Atopobium sp. oral taxon 416 TaxID=712157 RepID=UPI001BAA8CAE|nr:hypothetical protein [Atopobium sp. oral taxon 416]QUC04148.1 hypothetical protein J4859_04195 [Atopobium sp. oral taxon 416]